MPDRTPQYGLPYQRLPQSHLTPESMLEQEIQTGRQAIQDKYALQWKEVNRSRRFIGAGKANRMLQQIDMSAKQEMLQFNQQAQQQLEQLQNIDRLAEQGAITNPDEIKARMAFGTDVAKSMYPTPEKEISIPEEFGRLDVYSHRISDELERFKEDKPSRLLPARVALAGPLMGGALAAYYGRRKLKRKVRVWDPTTSEYKKATPEQIAEYDMLLQEEKAITQRKKELLGRLDVSRRIVQPGTRSGFDAGVAESVRPQRQRPVTKPKVIRQRNKRTGQERISYDGGKTWQIVTG